MTSVSGTMYGSKTLVYNDDNRLTSLTYGGVTDLYYYTYAGLRYRARLGGTYYRYLYNGERVLEDLNDSGTMQARYTTENDSYYGQWLHLYRPSGTLSRFPMYDNIGSTRGLLDASGAATDWYELDTFGRQVSSSGSTPNPYRYGAAWGYITDPSGLLQLGQRFYWPEVGRFVTQDPKQDEINWYNYAGGNPLTAIDPEGRKKGKPKCDEKLKKQYEDEFDRAIDRCIRNANRDCKWGLIGGLVGGITGGEWGAIGGFLVVIGHSGETFHDCLGDAWEDFRVHMHAAGCDTDPYPPWGWPRNSA
jgi:RHS repeat-associated protein